MNYILMFIGMAFLVTSTPNEMEVHAKYIYKHLPSRWSPARKIKYSRQLSSRIFIESHRRGLDPSVLTAIARIESNYLYWVSRRGDGSHGVFQILQYDRTTREAAIMLSKCRYNHIKSSYWRAYGKLFLRRYANKAKCEDQNVALERIKTGNFSVKELKSKNHIIPTYIFAYEIKKHLDSAKKYRYNYHIKGCGLSKKIQNRILRYSAYNTGYKKPRYYYMSRICKYYKEIKGIK